MVKEGADRRIPLLGILTEDRSGDVAKPGRE
jgi:hypothetical protein